MGFRRAVAIGLAVAATGVAASQAGAFQTEVESFLIDPPGEPGDQPYAIKPLLSVKDAVPRTSNPSAQVQMVTIPDGLGAVSAGEDGPGGFVRRGSDFGLLMNHEHGKSEDQQFAIGEPEYQGAIISLWQMRGRDGETQVDSGDLAYERVFDTASGSSHAPARAGNVADAFGRFCSGFMAHDYKRYGFDRPIYFTGEESGGTDTYDEHGGIGVAVFEDDGERQLHTLPDVGHFNKENVVPVPGYEGHTVLMGLEDGPSGYRSQVYMYVGRQQERSSDPMRRNGLVGGRLYVLAGDGANSEAGFENGDLSARWVEVTEAARSSDTTLESLSQSRGDFDFFRVEDGDSRRGEMVFTTTGGDTSRSYAVTRASDQPGNFYGRLYDLGLDPSKPTRPARLSLEYDADEAVAGGGNALVSPDNLTLSDDHLLVEEDATGYGDDFMTERGRDAQVWQFGLTRQRGRTDLATGSALPIAELNCIWDGGRDDTCPGSGTWEASGVIDTSHAAGDGTFLTSVQAHSEAPPFPFEPDYGVPEEDGQLLILRPRDGD